MEESFPQLAMEFVENYLQFYLDFMQSNRQKIHSLYIYISGLFTECLYTKQVGCERMGKTGNGGFYMKILRSKLLCFALTLCMLMSLAPVSALAVNGEIPEISAPAVEGSADAAEVAAVIGDAAQSISDGEDSVAEDMAPGDMIQGDLYDTDFVSRESTVRNLRDAMIARKTEIYLYWRSDVALTEGDIEALLTDALLLDDHPLGGDYLTMHVLDYYAEWAVIAEEPGSYYNMIGFAMAYSTTAEQENELSTRVNELQSTIFEGKLNEYQKIKSLYDYIMGKARIRY